MRPVQLIIPPVRWQVFQNVTEISVYIPGERGLEELGETYGIGLETVRGLMWPWPWPWDVLAPCPEDVLPPLKSCCLVISLKCLYNKVTGTIRKTCPCNVYPLEPHFYIAKLGYGGVYLFFLFLLQNIDCGYSLEPPQLEPPRRGGSNMYPQSMFWAKIRKISKFISWKFSIFKAKKNLCLLHGHVFVMQCIISV